MIYEYKTTIGITYYEDLASNYIYMSIQDYCAFVGKSETSVSCREAETIRLVCCTKTKTSIELLTEDTIVNWLIIDKPECLKQLIRNGFRNHLDDLTDD